MKKILKYLLSMKTVLIFFIMIDTANAVNPDHCDGIFENDPNESYKILPWTLDITPEEGEFQFDSSIRPSLNLELWQEYKKHGQIEVGIIEVFDANGNVTAKSNIAYGNQVKIHAERVWERWVEIAGPWKKNHDLVRNIRRIRITHIHPNLDWVTSDGKVVRNIEPRTLSASDIKAARKFRRILSKFEISRGIQFEMVSVTWHYPVIDIEDLPEALSSMKPEWIQSASVHFDPRTIKPVATEVLEYQHW